MKKVAIIQSNYIPWKGYFDIIHDVDLFIFYDDVQFTPRDWRTRNKLKTPRGAEWLTIPAGADRSRLICNVALGDSSWQEKHYKTICLHYAKAPCFNQFHSFLKQVYLDRKWENLSELNQYVTMTIAREFLDIGTEFRDSREYGATGTKLDRLLDLLRQAGADLYVSGPAARDYIDPEVFARAGIELVYKDYAGYPEYPQFHPPFEHGVTILDLLFHAGPDSPWYIWGWRKKVPV